MLRYISDVSVKYDRISLQSHTARTFHQMVAKESSIKKTVAMKWREENPEIFLKFSKPITFCYF